MEQDDSSTAMGNAQARQRLLAIFGQVQAYIFQVEILKRCDPSALQPLIGALKLNALTIRKLKRKLGGALMEQARHQQTPLACALAMALEYAHVEGERVLRAADNVTIVGAEGFFRATMKLDDPCEYHVRVHLETYGGPIDAEVQFLHDAENFLKQLNYCHLITGFGAGLAALENVASFLTRTVGSGIVVPPELCDPTHPCSVCFEELCVTANQGEAVHRRLLECTCDHITRQMSVRVANIDIARHLPHALSVSVERRAAAEAALKALEARRVSGHNKNDNTEDPTHLVASRLLEAHNVFKPASRCLYAVSELKFWLASAKHCDEGPPRAIDTFTENLETLNKQEKFFHLQAATVELALFGRTFDHFERIFADSLIGLDVIDGMLVGSCAVSPDDYIEALIKACYTHHMSTPLLQRLTDPDTSNREALKQLLGRIGVETNSGSAELGGNLEIDLDTMGCNPQVNTPSDEGALGKPVSEERPWDKLFERASADASQRRRMYAERLSKRSLASLGRCVREQRKELEKTLRVNVYGDVLLHTYVLSYNGFCARRGFCEAVSGAGTIIDNRSSTSSFDSHQFMKAALLRHPIDQSLMPSITHKFFELINGPVFDNAGHNFAQPPNTALYYSVENVGLLPHLKEELARFMVTAAKGDWSISEFQRFYCFEGVTGVTATQRLAWKYIGELILAAAVFSSVFHCGEVRLLRADRTYPNTNGAQRCASGIYITYETSCPLVAVLSVAPNGVIGEETVVIYDSDVFSLLYTVLQQLAPGSGAN
ncbi:DNA packaging terminase subunit 2 [Equid alphaherpesvirus 4]|uniref:DNA packaging terminase subunit 2 n=1 Tax=Equid alphaherpesvirus 4 TaxID=10331 RepID=A0A120HUF1_9ALPH|nr:DNA packaging terminase subunit 2 [Equid alphaherpesvirus 4]AMB15993.1 DNA packaging terminase subunit 2 [Equid alphaherpesvirus 4]AMB16625.1 DNA packaging terminase subunit 2 [Equid alphaherpesvirus 4]AMB16704.1 DNA packaging terminase subunit 2 [Equid alphaherpesvirus 4]AMB16783.1 DNA packaging terminase subunit 2 [Equid alphaherpesvirus 4]